MVSQWLGPIGDAGLWFHGGVVWAGTRAEPAAPLDGQNLETASAPTAAPPNFQASRRVTACLAARHLESAISASSLSDLSDLSEPHLGTARPSLPTATVRSVPR